MKKNRLPAAFLSLSLLAALPLASLAETTVDTELEGLVTELVEGGFVMNDAELGEVMLNVDDQTALDGILAEEPIAVGQYVIVAYDGRLTRSIPPQAHADKVGCYVLNGTVGEFLESGVLLLGDELFGDVIVHIESKLPHVFSGVPITVYYDGVMALSLPGQVLARHVIVPELTGTVSGRDDEGFTLTDGEGAKWRVMVGENTLVDELADEAADGATEDVADMPDAADGATAETSDGVSDQASDGASDAAQANEGMDEAADMNAPVAMPENADETEMAEATHAPEAATEAAPDTAPEAIPGQGSAMEAQGALVPVIDIQDGDTVTVYYSGVATKSEPPQVSALEVLLRR